MSDDSASGDGITRTALGTWGPLHLLEEVGRGGFGIVYRAWEPVLAREVALKVIRPREARADAIAELLREGQLLARVRHAHVVTVFGAQQIGNEIGLWMEFVHGRSLSDLVTREGPRAANEAALIGITLCQALAAVHRAGVIHRDIKAQNVMRESGGRVVLMDFGAGQVLKPSGTHRDDAIGTPAYMAPELMLGAPASAVSDIYSLGVLLYYLVTGAHPVEGKTWSDFLLAHARAERRPLGDVRPDIPAGFVRTVERATALRPDERFQTAGALLGALTETASGMVAVRHDDPSSPRQPVVDPRPQAVSIDRRIVLAGLAAVGIWILGAITSAAFNLTLGRIGEFATESALSWWLWGLRSLISGAVYSTIVLLVVAGIRAITNLLIRTVPQMKDLAETTSVSFTSITRRTWLQDLPMLSQTMLVLQVLAITVFCLYFRDFFSALMSFVSTASPEDLEAFRPDNIDRHGTYNLSMSMLILAMSVAAYQIRKAQRQRGVKMPASFRANLAAIGFALVVLVLPWRLIWWSHFEVAFYGEARCYILSETTSALLLYCPTSEIPKTRKIPQLDANLKRTGQVEKVYTRPSTKSM